ncbi:FtsX-like permease family protein [Paenibacillus wynnii]|uniref:FtsX-like permease family protein n=1 Tax=Paenibacillus wynnii TaxID=268407 RepID=UPI0027933362|nr:ABC transporter permease [Paenibacillus wynnii]MDQ0194479.1 putative ABC transport system permease protein [Paenibacillus wynnii]
MTFRRMAFQIFKANLRRYLLFFLCSSFTIMIFFTFATLSNNPDFMDSYKVNGMISGNLYAPTLILKVFAVLFLFYAQTAFVKFRKSDYGLFMVLGMTHHNIRKMLLFENSMIAVASILTGLGLGTIFSGIFYGIVSLIVDVRDISFRLTMESYKNTVIFFVVIYIVVIASSLVLTLRYSIVNLLKESRTADRSLIHGNVPGIIGIVLIAIAVWDWLSLTAGQSNLVLRSLFICFVGVYLVMSSLSDWISLALKQFSKNNHKNMLFVSDIRYSFGQSKIVLFLITILVTFSLMLSSLVLFLTIDTLNMATRQNPNQIAYAEVFGKNHIPQETLDQITDHGDTPLSSHQVLEYMDLHPFKVFSDQNLNTITGSHYKVEQGHFLNLSLYDQSEGYQGEIPDMPTYDLDSPAGKKTLVSQGVISKMLFNRIPIVSNGLYVVLNEQDYIALKPANIKKIGHIHLLNFENWKKTAELDAKLNAALVKYNKQNTESWYGNDRQDAAAFQTQSRIATYTQLKQAGEFGVMLFAFVGLLFFLSSGVLLHFRILTDWEREKIKFRKLKRIGITSKEAAKIIAKPFRLLFFFPYILGIVLSTFYFVYAVKIEAGKIIEPLNEVLLVGGIYLGFQLLFYLIYIRRYTHRMLAEIGLES